MFGPVAANETPLKTRNGYVGNMQQTLWYLLMDAMEQRHLFGQDDRCQIHERSTNRMKIPVCFIVCVYVNIQIEAHVVRTQCAQICTHLTVCIRT